MRCVCVYAHTWQREFGFSDFQRDLRSLFAGVEGALATWRAPQQLSTRGLSTAALEVMGPYSTHLKLTCLTQFLQPSFCTILTYFADQVIYIMIRWLIRWVLSLGNLMMEHPSAGFCMVKSALLIVPLYNPNSPTFFCIVKSCVLMVKSHEVSTFHAELPTRRTRDPHVPGEALRGPALPAWPPARTPRGKPLRHDAAAVSNRQAGWGELEGIYFL